ncbi:MAG TPA: site-specific integrase [Firmicutes bacterium]|nr:site-specific integrase [Bacillota bacterium]
MAKKEHKRGKGEGTIYQRPDGTWAAQVSTGHDPKTGKLKRRTFYGKTRAEVAQKMSKAVNDVNTGTYSDPSTITLEKWLYDWLEGKINIEEESRQLYNDTIRQHIAPEIGKKKLADIRYRDIQTFITNKSINGRLDGRGGLSPKMVRRIYRVLFAALKQAVKERLVTYNEADGIELPKAVKHDVKTLSIEEVTKFLTFIKEHPNYVAIRLDLYCGLRRGELLGLRWKDIDFKNGVINITQQIVTSKKIKGLKTTSSKRAVTLYGNIIDLLKEHKKQQNEFKLLLGTSYQKELDLVFCHKDGSLISPKVFYNQYKALLDQAGLDSISFHALRHTAATLMLEAGIPAKTVQEILGHSTISTTLDVYGHVTPKMQTDAAIKMNEIISI